jgi:hypothetical protein
VISYALILKRGKNSTQANSSQGGNEMKVYAAILILIVAFLVLATDSFAQDWNFQIVNAAGGYNSQIAATSDGTPYLLYRTGNQGDIYLARWIAAGGGYGTWEKILIYAGCGSANMEMLVDSGDNLHIAFFSCNNLTIYYSVFSSLTKTITLNEVVSTGESAWGGLDLAISEDGEAVVPAIVYAGAILKIATRDPDSGVWSADTIYANNTPSAPSIAVDATGNYHISFMEYIYTGSYIYSLMYATNANPSNTWVSEYVEAGGMVGEYNSIVIEEGNIPYIVYYDISNGDLKYARLVTP